MRKTFIFFFIGLALAAGGDVEEEEIRASAWNVNRECQLTTLFTVQPSMTEDAFSKLIARRLSKLGKFKSAGDFNANLEAFILGDLKDILDLEPIEDYDDLTRAFEAEARRILQPGKTDVDVNEVFEAAMRLFKRYFITQKCPNLVFNAAFLEAANAAANDFDVFVSSQSGQFTDEYNLGMNALKEEIEKFVKDESAHLCECRGKNGVIELFKAIHNPFTKVIKLNSEDLNSVDQFVDRMMFAIQLVDENLSHDEDKDPASTDLLQFFASRYIREKYNDNELSEEAEERQEFRIDVGQRLINGLIELARDKGYEAQLLRSIQNFLYSYARSYFSGTALPDDTENFIKRIAFHDDIHLVEGEMSEKKIALSFIKIMERSMYKIPSDDKVLNFFCDNFDRLMELNELYREAWFGVAILHSEEYFLFQREFNEELAIRVHDLLGRFVVNKPAEYERDLDAGVALDKYLDEIYAKGKTDRAALYMLKLINGLAILGVEKDLDYTLTLQTDESVQKLQQELLESWDWAPVYKAAEKMAAENGRLIKAEVFRGYLNFDEEIEDREGEEEDEYNTYEKEDFEAGLEGDINNLVRKKKNKKGPAQIPTKVEPVVVPKVQIKKYILEQDCTITEKTEDINVADFDGSQTVKYYTYQNLNFPIELSVFQDIQKTLCGDKSNKGSNQVEEEEEPVNDIEEIEKPQDLPVIEVTGTETLITLKRDCNEYITNREAKFGPDEVPSRQFFFVILPDGSSKSVEEDEFINAKRICEQRKKIILNVFIVGPECQTREERDTRNRRTEEEEQEQTVYRKDNGSVPTEISPDEYFKIIDECNKVYVYTDHVIENCIDKSTSRQLKKKPQRPEDLDTYTHVVKGQRDEVTKEAFQRIQEDCDKIREADVRTNIVRLVQGVDLPEVIQKLKESRDMIEFMRDNASLDANIDGEDVELVFVQVDPVDSACYKGSEF